MKYDVIIIGAGPAGYVAAIRAGQVGFKTALIEKKHVGGMCLNWGCVPTKAIIESGKFFRRLQKAEEFGISGIDQKKIVFDWEQATKRAGKIVNRLTKGIEYLLKKNGVDIIEGTAIINGKGSVSVNNRLIEGENIVIATGSYPIKVEGNVAAEDIVEIENLFSLKEIPTHLVLTGHGPTVAEMAQFFAFIGKKVTVLLSDDFIIHDCDRFLSEYLFKKLQSEKITFIKAQKIDSFEKGILKAAGGEIKCDLIINCNYRKAIVPDSKTELELTDDGFIKTDDNLQTSIAGIYAIGDVNGRSYLAHAASAQGIWVINHLKGIQNNLNLRLYPLNIYTSPEIAQIGHSQSELQEMGFEIKISEFPLTANAKALSEGNNEGLIRILSEPKYGQVLGVQIIAENATDLIAEASVYMQFEATVFDIAQTIHAHPTISEIFTEAGFDAFDKAIHK